MTEQLIADDSGLRLNLLGFSLKKLESILGSGDLDLVARLKVTLAENEEDLEELPQVIAETGKVLEVAILKGAPIPALVVESDSHVLAALLLAEHDQELTATGSDSWQAGAFWTLAQQFSEEVEPQTRKLLGFFCEGRPLFGKVIETDSKYYGYLTAAELLALRAELTELEDYVKDWEETGTLEFLRDLISWLNTVAEAEQDLWFYTS